ncbi:response regulator [Ruminococcus sp. NK3A76]|uniref:response regulator n=1 Tax=Ruminococcus sp. NK3A76 TaxID=877411 RepID=UPI00069071CC|nr:response regulator [Ruminococcus sp. NK3A76]
MIYYYHFNVIFSVLLSSVFLIRWRRDIPVHFPMIFLLIPIINLGYLKVATAENVNEALLANGIGYLDGCFLELFFFLYIMSFCKLKVPKVISGGMLAVGAVTFFFAINTAQNHLLYTSAELRQIDGVSYLVKEYGFVHTVYYVIIALYLVANLSAITYSFTRKNVSKINSMLLLTMYILIMVAFLAGKFISPAFELLPLAYTISQALFLVVLSKITLYDVSASTLSNLEEKGDIGFASFDRKMRYLGCTDAALECLPELGTIYIDKTLTAENETFRKILECTRRISEWLELPSFTVTRNNTTYKVTVSFLYSGKRIKGYLLRTEDNTQESRKLEALKLRERQKELEAKMLRLEKTEAEAANEAKSTFLAQMSHEIRTPINAVLGMNEMILRESREPGIREYAANIQSSGKTLLSLINSILDLSKIENGKMEIVPAEYDTAVMISDIAASISPKAAEKGLEFECVADEDLPCRLKGDDVRIRQIILNLLSNAVKYTKSGSVKLTIGMEDSSDEGSITLNVSVNDTGIGIRHEDMDGLFESFRRLDTEHTRSIEGTGLGMPIVIKLLELMGGELKVDSEYGKGSDFSFTLTQQIADSTPMGNYKEHPTAIAAAQSATLHLYAPEARVLVVDDNDMNLKVAKSLLHLFGIEADTADSGRAALDILKKSDYDVIFLDQMMPGMDGIEVLGEIRARHLTDESTAIIALTANAIVGAKEMYLNAGFDNYLTKPIESKDLEKQLRRYLPEDKQKLHSADEDSDLAETDELSIIELKRIRDLCPGINAMTGLKYCMDSKQFWFEMLDTFAAAGTGKELNDAFEANDTERYRIAVHAIKSTALNIGAELLSEKARLLEAAAKADDKEYINDNHSGFIKEYDELTEQIRQIVNA